ncbi:hypothetical protein D920_00266 [Enterococcus faecalis 13-SD-W-01]|nr:hypothetical protein D920_00266 [Enterococcus faecalis 13-SD-W-01]
MLMTTEEFEAKFTDFCKTASELSFHILMNGLLNINAGAKEVKRLEDSYQQRFGHPFTQKELTPAATDVSR